MGNYIPRIRLRSYWLEWLLIALAIYLYVGSGLLDANDQQLQQTGEHNESATLPILAEIGLLRYGEIPLWNPYMMTGFPYAGDPINHFWNPLATLPILQWGGIGGMKVSVFLSLLVAAYGQWYLAHTFGVRGVFRLWAGLLFALSGGIAGLWWLGWYELLLGVAWFPWCFALLWRALHRRDRLSQVLAALAAALVITTGGGYYPLYLGVSLAVLTAFALIRHNRGERLPQLRRAVTIAVLAAGLSAVYLLPIADGIRFTVRDAPPDSLQTGSQPIAYSLFNYVVSDRSWLRADVLNKGSATAWSYIGFLPLLALAFTPWLYSRFRWRRRDLVALLALLLVLLLWIANRYAPVRYLYDWFPFLQTFRFPNRLLTVAAIPLIVVAAINLQGLLVLFRNRWRGAKLGVARGRERRVWGIGLVRIVSLAAALLLGWALLDVFRVNSFFINAPHERNPVARDALVWLRWQDPGLYYTNIGGEQVYWDWVAYAYELELPVLNFRYNRGVRSMDDQYAASSPFSAQPKYVIIADDQPPPPGATLVNTFEDVNVWRRDDVLPVAFTVADPAGPIRPETVAAQTVEFGGPNRVLVVATAEAGEQLVTLVSDYPGWRLWIDGRPASLKPLNGYLGAETLPGKHTYVFGFHPPTFYVGALISVVALLSCVWLAAADLWRWWRTPEAGYSRPAIEPA